MKIPICIQTAENNLTSILKAKVYIIFQRITKVRTNIFIKYENMLFEKSKKQKETSK